MAQSEEHLDETILAALKALALDASVPARDRVAAARELREWLDRDGAGTPGDRMGPGTDPGSLTLADVDAALARS